MKTISLVITVAILFACASTRAQNNLPPYLGHADTAAAQDIAQRYYLCGQFDGEIWAIQEVVKSLSAIAGKGLNANTRIAQIRAERTRFRCKQWMDAVGLEAPK